MTPIFKRNEVVIRDTYVRGVGADLGEPEYEIAEVTYKGVKTVDYEVGDQVYVERKRGKKVPNFMNILDNNIIIFAEEYVMCKVETL